jgi:protein phosphatase
MTDSVAKIQCINDRCKSLNLQNLQFCPKCYTPIIKRYLWSLGEGIDSYHIGDLISDRYLLRAEKIILDTKPGLTPHLPEDIPWEIEPYLKLFPYRVYLPQVYGYIEDKEPIWLLEYSAILLDQEGELIHPQLWPRLDEQWPKASPLRQLNWLWQIIQIWQPLADNQVVSSLLNPNLLRVNGPVIQLLELQPDLEPNPSFKKLGKLWFKLSNNCHRSIGEIVTTVALYLQQKLITEPEKVLTILDRAIYQLANDGFTRQYQIITATDPGRMRQGNEDACYPSPEKLKDLTGGINTLTIVCDGLGGQEGGEIASQLAIDILKQELFQDFKAYTNKLYNQTIHKHWNPLVNLEKLTAAVCKANNHINQRNNQEKRQERERMGTTVVMTLALDHEMYLTHVGDSRIYWITNNGCYQLTVDDDLASREVRFGYAFYRDIIQYPQTGSLLQALGMEDAQHLHPHLQRFIVDEDCVFLLCSDGLSDFERVEQYWQSQILPILDGKIHLVKAAKNLLNIGLRRNGHDNITIGLVYCQVRAKEDRPATILSWNNLNLQEVIDDLPDPLEPPDKIQLNLNNKPTMPVKLLLIISLILLSIAGLCFSQWQAKKNNSHQQDHNYHLPPPTP